MSTTTSPAYLAIQGRDPVITAPYPTAAAAEAIERVADYLVRNGAPIAAPSDLSAALKDAWTGSLLAHPKTQHPGQPDFTIVYEQGAPGRGTYAFHAVTGLVFPGPVHGLVDTSWLIDLDKVLNPAA